MLYYENTKTEFTIVIQCIFGVAAKEDGLAEDNRVVIAMVG